MIIEILIFKLKMLKFFDNYLPFYKTILDELFPEVFFEHFQHVIIIFI